MAGFYKYEHEIFRTQVRKFIETEILPHHIEWEKEGIVPRSIWEKAGSLGLLCCDVDTDYGGVGGDFGHLAIVVEELMRVNATGVGFPTHSVTVAPYIANCGNYEQKMRWLPKMVSGQYIGAVAMTEPGVGSDLKSIKTTAIRSGDHYIINGQKTFVTNGTNADLIVVACSTDKNLGAKGVSLLVVERETIGFQRGQPLNKIGMKAQDTTELFFNEAKVPLENLLGEENKGFSYLMQNLPQERLLVAIRSIAILESILEQSIDYTKGRQAFGKSIFNFQNTRFKLAQAKAEIMMLRTHVNDCLLKHLEGDLSAVDAAIVKLNASDMAVRILDDLLQLYGGYGFMSEYLVGKSWVDSRVYKIFAGTNEIMKEIIARSL